jgi:hypothetical protein
VEVEVVQCIWCLADGLDGRGSVPIIFQKLPLVQSVHSDSYAIPRVQFAPEVLSAKR